MNIVSKIVVLSSFMCLAQAAADTKSQAAKTGIISETAVDTSKQKMSEREETVKSVFSIENLSNRIMRVTFFYRPAGYENIEVAPNTNFTVSVSGTCVKQISVDEIIKIPGHMHIRSESRGFKMLDDSELCKNGKITIAQDGKVTITIE